MDKKLQLQLLFLAWSCSLHPCGVPDKIVKIFGSEDRCHKPLCSRARFMDAVDRF